MNEHSILKNMVRLLSLAEFGDYHEVLTCIRATWVLEGQTGVKVGRYNSW
jgi:hypothetical protein